MATQNPTSQSPTVPSSVPQLDARRVIGPIFVGNAINWFLFGALVLQVYIYSTERRRIKDPYFIRLLVYGTFALDIVQTVVATADAWTFMIAEWGQPEAVAVNYPVLASLIPVLGGAVAFLVQVFYAWRIWSFAHNIVFRCLSCIISMLALLQFIGSFVGSVLSATDHTIKGLERIRASIDIWLAGSFVTDILITGCMIWLLLHAQKRTVWSQTSSILNKLIVNTIQTGLITSLVAGVDLFLWVHYKNDNYELGAAFILGKLYSNSFISSLNSRFFRSENRQIGTSSAGGSGGQVHVHISRDREQHIDDDNAVAETVSQPSNHDWKGTLGRFPKDVLHDTVELSTFASHV